MTILPTAYSLKPITCAPRARGYSMIELIVVIVILGVVAAIAGPRFFGTQTFSERGYADEIASAIRYSQKIAVGSGCNVRLSITLAGYSAMQQAASGNGCDASSASWTTPVLRSDGAPLSGSPPSDANVSGAATFVFNNRGAVISGATNLTVGPYTLALDAGSGFVEVQ
jgi:MSHA pilin protein MshC